MVNENDTLADAPKLDEPLLHLVPRLSIIFAAAINQGRAVIEEQNLAIAQSLFDKSLVRFVCKIQASASILPIHG